MNVFSSLQQSVIGRLTASAVAGIPSLVPASGQITWITEDIGDLANIISKTVGSLGIIGIVMTPGGGKRYQSPGIFPIQIVCPIEIQVQENVTVNRRDGGTQISALDLVQFCMVRLHLWSQTGQRINRIEVDETPYLMVSEQPLLVYNVRFNAQISITPTA